MGYYAERQKYLGTVRKTVTVSYPKSESGGSRTVTMEEPVYVDVYVESDPFEHSVDTCDNSLHLLQAGIVATEVAEKKSRIANSQRLGQSLDDGFFQVVNSNITMQAKEEAANAKALVGALYAQQKDLLNIRGRMEDDYNLIKSRYIKLFGDYDKELHHRIYALNKRIFRLVEETSKEQGRPTDSILMAASLVGQKENLSLQTQIAASRVKHLASLVILKVKDFIEGQNLLHFRLKHMLSGKCSKEEYYVPVVCAQMSDGKHSESKIFANELVSKDQKDASRLEQMLLSPTMRWVRITDDVQNRISESLSEQVHACYSDSDRERRVSALVMKLWRNNPPMILNK